MRTRLQSPPDEEATEAELPGGTGVLEGTETRALPVERGWETPGPPGGTGEPERVEAEAPERTVPAGGEEPCRAGESEGPVPGVPK